MNSPRGQALQEWHRSDSGWGGGSDLLSEVTTDAFLVLWGMAPMQSSQRCGLARESQKRDLFMGHLQTFTADSYLNEKEINQTTVALNTSVGQV